MVGIDKHRLKHKVVVCFQIYNLALVLELQHDISNDWGSEESRRIGL
jgi:hypothetical protein